MSLTSNPNINVDYDQKKGRFIITSPPWMVDMMRSIPNRRWDGRSKAWTAPGIRANVEHIKSKFKTANYTDAAAKYLAEYQPTKPSTLKFPTWYEFKTNPYDHQLDALHKTYGLRTSGLFMDMRTGKTKVVIDLHSAMRMEDKLDRVLLICPLSLRKNWVREIAIHAPIDIDAHLLDTSKPKKFQEWLTTPHEFKWLIVGVESLAVGSAIQYTEKFLLTSNRSSCVIDESSKIKNPAANRSKNCVKLGRMAEYRTIMTGTPIANGPLDLYMQFEFLDPDIIGVGDFYSFRNRYAVMGGYESREVIGYQNLDELIEIVTPFVFQVRQADVLDIPEKIRIIRTVQMSTEQEKIYKQMKKNKALITPDKRMVVKNTLEHMLRLQEIAGGSVSYENQTDDPNVASVRKERIAGKNPKIEELLQVTREYEGQTIVWCNFKSEIYWAVEALKTEYGDDQVVEIHGDVSEEMRDINVNELFQGSKVRFIVGNAATGGMGLTMNKAMVEIYYSNSFNFIDRQQSEERATGLNKPKGVVIVDLITESTVDEVIYEALVEKKDVSEFVRSSIDRVRAEYFN